MADGSFFQGVEELKEMVGDGVLKGTLTVDTPYAFNQHERHWINYMGRYGYKRINQYHGGGGEGFVEEPLMENYPRYYQNLADAVLEGTLREAMADNVEDMNDQLKTYAPEKSGNLKKSGDEDVEG